jgi:hypothetical protein
MILDNTFTNSVDQNKYQLTNKIKLFLNKTNIDIKGFIKNKSPDKTLIFLRIIFIDQNKYQHLK